MSKVVKKIGRHFKKVYSGINKLQKKIRKSKIFKVIAIAAAVYFTGGAVLGAMGGAGGGAGGMFAGAKAGIQAAWQGLAKAAPQLLQGNVSGAGSALKGGLQAAKTAGQAFGSVGQTVNAIGQGSASLGQTVSTATNASPVTTALGQAPSLVTQQSQALAGLGTPQASPMITGAPQTAAPGLLKTLASNPMTPYVVGQVGGSIATGIGNQKQQEDAQKYASDSLAEQRAYDEEQARLDRERFNTNIGQRLWFA